MGRCRVSDLAVTAPELNAGAGVGRLGWFQETVGVFVMAKKKSARKKVATSSLTAKLEKTIEKDFQACEETAANWRRSKRMDRET